MDLKSPRWTPFLIIWSFPTATLILIKTPSTVNNYYIFNGSEPRKMER